jgi:hypothetical protein
MRPLLAASAFAGVLLVSGLPVWAQAQTVTDLRPLSLRRSVNHVFDFTPDGRTATINREQATQDDHGVEIYRFSVATTGGQTQPVPVLDPRDGTTSNCVNGGPIPGHRGGVKTGHEARSQTSCKAPRSGRFA